MAITKTFILGAGLGTRLRPLTNHLPKPLVPVWNEPLVAHSLRHCLNAGITDFAINTHHLPHCWDAQFPDHSFEGTRISFFHEPVLLETGGGIKNIASFIGDDPILVFNGDIITDIDLKGLMNTHQESGNIATLAVKTEGPNCNIAIDDSGQVIDLRHALGVNPGNCQFTGIYCISPEILDLIPSDEKISIVPAFIELAKQGNIGSFNADSANWIDIGTIETYKEVHTPEKAKVSKNAKIAETATLAACFVGEQAEVGDGCCLNNCIIWPNAVVPDHTVVDDAVFFAEGSKV